MIKFREYTLTLAAVILCAAAFAQYPTGVNKQRLGWQTTADGLVWRGAIADTATIDPTGLLQAWAIVDTTSGVLYQYRGKAWRPVLAYAIQPFDSVTFKSNEGDADSAELKYNADIGSLLYGANDGAQIPVLPGHWYVRNDTSVTIPKGTLVRASGTLGASGRIKAKHFIGDNSAPAEYILGIVVKDIPVGEDGYVMFYGKIRKLNTDLWNEGDLLYPDYLTPGKLTNAPVYFKTPIAFVVHKSANQGVIAVRIQPENYLSRLHDVTLPGLAAQNILRYNGTYWIPGRDTSVYDFDARLKNDRTVLMNNFDMKFRNVYSEDEYVQIRPTFVAVRDSFPGYNVVLNKFGIDGNGSSIKMAGGIQLSGFYAANTPGIDPDISINDDGVIAFRVSGPGTVDSLYGKTAGGLLTAVKPNYLAYPDTAAMLSSYLKPSEILAGDNIVLAKDSTVKISAPIAHTGSTAIIDVAEVVVDGLGTLRLPWDGARVVGIIKTGLYLTSGVNNQFVQYELIPNGDKGDITTSAGGAVMTIDPGAVTNEKANFSTLPATADTAALLLGVGTTGKPNTVALGGGLTLSGGQLTVVGLAGGTVTSIQGGNGIITDPAGGITATGTVRADTGVLASKVWAGNALAVKLNAADTASLSNRINLKLNAADTASLSNRINARILYTDTLTTIATKANLTLKLNASDTASLSNRIDLKQNTITGAATSITSSNLAASRALVSDASGKVAASSITATELGYLDNVTGTTGAGNLVLSSSATVNGLTNITSFALKALSPQGLTYMDLFGGLCCANGWRIQRSDSTGVFHPDGSFVISHNGTQFPSGTAIVLDKTLNAGFRERYPKQALHVKGKIRADTLSSAPLFIAGIGTDSTIVRLSADSLPSIAELKHVKGVTSAIQTQLNGKLSSSAGAVGEANLATGAVTGTKAAITGITNHATRLVGAHSNGNLDTIAVGSGLNLTNGILTSTTVPHYVSITAFGATDTIPAALTNSKDFFVVHSGLNGYCIDSYQVRARSGTGSIDVQISLNGVYTDAQTVSGTTTVNKNTNRALSTGDVIQVNTANGSGTLIGLSVTYEIKQTCN